MVAWSMPTDLVAIRAPSEVGGASYFEEGKGLALKGLGTSSTNTLSMCALYVELDI
jgi:hypothetical protein